MSERVGVSYKQHPPGGDLDATVIDRVGDGKTGCGGRPGQVRREAGAVLERRYTPGGHTHVFRRTEHERDVVLHPIGQVHDPRSKARRVFDDVTNGRLASARIPEVYDRIIIGDRAYALAAGIENVWMDDPRASLEGYPVRRTPRGTCGRGYGRARAERGPTASVVSRSSVS